jgi:hypothetical protein
MLLKNDIIEYDDEPRRRLRVLWVDQGGGYYAYLDLSDLKSRPHLTQTVEVLEDLRAGRAVIADKPPTVLRLPESIPELHQAKRDALWAKIKDIVSNEPDVYIRLRRAKMITSAEAACGASRPTLVKALDRYWRRGMTPNALLPDFENCGGKGKERPPGEKKRGRPPRSGTPGLNVTTALRRVFAVAVQRYAQNSKFDLPAAYHKMLGDYFGEFTKDEATGRVKFNPLEEFRETGYPTFDQFEYWVAKDLDMLDVRKRRMTNRVWELTERALIGTSAAQTWGPGARYQIDATIADVYLVSRLDPTKIIGRPVLYVVIDVFSRLVVGVYVGLEGPSWVGAMMALANTVAPKADFCRRLGIEITDEEWPANHLPATLLGDRGEIEARLINTLQNTFNVFIENAAAYRADWKGVVETRFKLIPAKFKPYVLGYIDTDYRARGGTDYRLDATLNLDDFTEIVVRLIVYFNNHHELKGYDREPGMTADGVPSIPVDLWNWGIVNRSGLLRRYPENQVKFALMPVKEAIVTHQGIRFQGLFYSGQVPLKERWFERARRSGVWKVWISYDPRDSDVVYLHTPDQHPGYDICNLTSRSRDSRNASLQEVGAQLAQEQTTSAARKMAQQNSLVEVIAGMEKVVQRAAARKTPSRASDAERVRGIRPNRAVEKSANRTLEAGEFRLQGTAPPLDEDVGQVLPFAGRAALANEDDYAGPSIADLKRLMENGDG